jgi:hypothetical protein
MRSNGDDRAIVGEHDRLYVVIQKGCECPAGEAVPTEDVIGAEELVTFVEELGCALQSGEVAVDVRGEAEIQWPARGILFAYRVQCRPTATNHQEGGGDLCPADIGWDSSERQKGHVAGGQLGDGAGVGSGQMGSIVPQGGIR